MTFKYGDRVLVHDIHGDPAGEGTVVNFNEFRDPESRYAIDADFYKEDFIFVGKDQLTKIEEED